MAESLLVLFGSPDDDRATIGALLVARGLDDLATCAAFATSTTRAHWPAVSQRILCWTARVRIRL